MKNFIKKFLCLAIAISVVGASAVTDTYAAAKPSITATSAMLYCDTTGETLWSKNSSKELNLASITKLMTCLIAVEKLGLDYVVTVDEAATKVDKVESMVYTGEKITVEDLIYEALLCSANDAAKALSIATSGTQKKFTKLMNARAKKIGCTNTYFANASGIKLGKIQSYSTARDIVLIAKEAFSNEDICRIAGTAKYTLDATNKRDAKTISSTNLFLAGGEATTLTGKIKVKKYSGVFAGKTGTTPEFKTTMVVACDIDGFTVYAVIMNSTLEKRYSDIRKMLNYAKQSISKYTAFEKGAAFEDAKVKGGAVNKVKTAAAEDGFINLPEGASASLVTTKAVFNDEINAPVKKGDEVGKVEIYLADDKIREISLIATEDVEKGWFLSAIGISNLQTILIFALLIQILAFYITIRVVRAKNRRKMLMARRERARQIAMTQLERERDVKMRDWPY